ncbi:MAG: hypothetical protein M0Z42_01820 [Actinomycetota bacterium]|nr:hypothetical protein [Actinomycetota bacterium]
MATPDEPVGDETRAFQRFYLGDDQPPRRSLLYRLLVGWWRRRR